jgi:putative spermidine/putrescine transport system ATP-binding protein
VSPRILLLDEPFAALDKGLRLDMQIEVKRIQRLAGITCIMVTHDQEEALSMADRVAVINQGRLEQFDMPNQVYDQPASLFVNQFVGAANQLTGTLGSSTAGATATLDDGTTLAVRTPTRGLAIGTPILVCIRPEHLRLADGEQRDSGPSIKGTIELSLPLGPQIIHEVRLENGVAVKVVEARGEGARSREPGSAVVLLVKPGATISAFSLTNKTP